MDLDLAIQQALLAVTEACRLCRNVQQDLVSADTLAKKDQSPVTVADFGAQAIVSARLAAAFPDIPLLAEEDASDLRRPEQDGIRRQVGGQVRRLVPALADADVLNAIDRGGHAGGTTGRHWVLDPVDGTKGFLRRDQYAIALALIEEGRVVAGVLGCPNLPWASSPGSPRGCLFSARRGRGAVVRPLDAQGERTLHVTSVADSEQACFCESVEAGHSSHSDAARIAALLGVTQPPYRIDSQCKYGAVARGDASIYLRLPTRKDYEERVWDHAAGTIVVEEAGGRVTDVDGKPLDFSRGRTLSVNTGVMATNGRLHDQVLAAVRTVLQRP